MDWFTWEIYALGTPGLVFIGYCLGQWAGHERGWKHGMRHGYGIRDIEQDDRDNGWTGPGHYEIKGGWTERFLEQFAQTGDAEIHSFEQARKKWRERLQ